jgi:hypothetical protein
VRYFIGSVIAFFLALIQASSVQQFHALGVTPNLLLVLLVSWMVVRGLEDVLPLILVSGVTLGLVGLESPGLLLLALLPVAALGTVRELHVIHSETVLALATVAPATPAYEVVLIASVMADGGELAPVAALRFIVAPAVLVNLALTPPVYLLMRLARPAPRRGRLAW